MATVNRQDNTSLLNTGPAWSGAVAPTSADIASWGATVNIATNTGTALGGSVSWGGIKLQSGQTSNITIPTSASVLTVGASGIDLSTAGANLTISSNTTNSGGITIGTSQTWTVASGRTLNIPNMTFTAGTSPTWTVNVEGSLIGADYYWNLGSGANVALVKNGAGTMTLRGSSVTYDFGTTGSITVNAGTFQWDTGLNKPSWNAASLTIASGAAFSVNWTGGTIGYLAGAGTLKRGPTAGNFNPTFGNSVPTNATFSGNIDTTAGVIGTFTKSGTNVQTLSGDSTATWSNAATVAVTGGGLVLSNAGALGASTGANNISSGAYLALNGVTYSSSGTRTTSVTSGGQFRVVAGGVWNSSGAVTIAGTGISSTGAIYGDGNANNAIGAPITLGTTPTIYSDTGGTLTINSTVTMAANILTFAGPGTHVMAGTLAGTGPVVKDNAGILKLTTASTKTAGAWTLNGGETWLSNANALGAAASSIAVSLVASGAKLYVADAVTIPSNKTIADLSGTLGATGAGGGTWSGAITLGSTSAAIENNTSGVFTLAGGINLGSTVYLVQFTGSGSTTAAGTISGSSAGAVAVSQSGSGTTTFTAQNTYTGVFRIAAGVANAGVDEAGGATLGLNGPFGNSTSAGSMLFTGGTLQYSALNARDYSSRFATTGSQQWRIDTNGRNVTFATALAGTGSSLTKLGAGTLTVASSSYTGATSILGGTLQALSLANAGSNSSLGASSSAATNLVIDGGTLRYASGTTSTNRLFTVGAGGATLDLNNVTFSQNSGTIPIQGSTTLTLTGTGTNYMYPILADSGAFVLGIAKNGTGTWSLIASNTFTGPISVNAGTLEAGAATALGATSGARTLTVASGATFQVSGPITYSSLDVRVSGTGVGGTSGAVLLTNTATIPITLQSASFIRFASASPALQGTINTNGYDLTIAGSQAGQVFSVIFGSGNLIVGATGNTANVQLNGQNTFTGTTTTSGATLLVSGSLGLGSYSANIINNGGITFQSVTAHTISGVVSGTGTLTVGSGDVTLTNTNTYTGRTVNGGGFLRIASIADLGVNSNIGAPAGVSGTIGIGASSRTIYTGAAASTNRPIDLQGATGSATITNNGSGTLSFTASAWTATGAGSKTVTFNGSSPISVASTIVNNSSTNTTALTYSGSSTLTLSGVSTYTGLTSVSSGTIDISSGDNRLASGGSITVSGTTGSLALGTANQTTTTLTTGGTGNSLTGTGTLTATTYNASSVSGTTTVGPNLVVSGTTTKSNAGALVLNGSNSFGVYTHNAGTTTFASTNTFSGAFTMSAGTVTFSAANTFGSTFTASGTVNYNAANNFGGLGTISAGLSSALTLNGTGSNVTLSQNIDIANTTNFLLPTANSQLTLSGVLSGSASNVFIGATTTTVGANSVLRLTNNANSWSGSSLNIQNGALYISDARQLGTGSKTVAVRTTSTGAVGFVLDGSSADILLPSTVSFTTSSGTGVTPQPTYFGIVNVAGNNVIQGTISMTGGGGDSTFSSTGGTLTLAGAVSAAATGRTMQLTGTSLGEVTGVISNTNTPAVTVSGSSTWTLSGSNAYAGGTLVSGTGTVVAGSETGLGTGAVQLVTSGATLQTRSAGNQNGKLTIADSLANLGGTIRIGGGYLVPANRAFVLAPTTDFNNTAINIVLDPAVITGPGRYAMIYSPVALTNYAGANAPTFSSAPSWSYSSITVTSSGNGDRVNIGGTNYYAVLVTIV